MLVKKKELLLVILCGGRENGKKMKENAVYCVKCDEEMQGVLLPVYEYQEGLPLHNVSAFRCNICGKIFFTEAQAKEMEARSHETKEYLFGFERKISICGKSLVVTVPHEVAAHLNMKTRQAVKLFPIAREGFLIKKMC
jgi:hypothetical protein